MRWLAQISVADQEAESSRPEAPDCNLHGPLPRDSLPQLDSTSSKPHDLLKQCHNLETKSSTHESAEYIPCAKHSGLNAQHLSLEAALYGEL